jgi:hypothetical protein
VLEKIKRAKHIRPQQAIPFIGYEMSFKMPEFTYSAVMLSYGAKNVREEHIKSCHKFW